MNADLRRDDVIEHRSKRESESTGRWNGLTSTRFGPVALTYSGLGSSRSTSIAWIGLRRAAKRSRPWWFNCMSPDKTGGGWKRAAGRRDPARGADGKLGRAKSEGNEQARGKGRNDTKPKTGKDFRFRVPTQPEPCSRKPQNPFCSGRNEYAGL